MQIADVSFGQKFDALILTLFIITILAFISAAVRIATRVWWVKQPGTDDAFIALALVFTVGYLTASIQLFKYSLKVEQDPDLTMHYHKALYYIILAYTATHFSFKFSILFQSRRIFVDPQAQRLFLGLIVYLTVYGIICLVLTILTCWPVEKFWNESVPGGCVERKTLYDVFAGINIFNDLALLVSPMPFIKGLQIAKKTRFALMGLFACGGFACIFAIIRAHSLYDKSSEKTFKGSNIVCVWSGLEINIAIICACVPALRQLFLGIAHRINSSAIASRRRNRRFSTRGSIPIGSTGNRVDRILGKDGNDIETGADRAVIEAQESFEMKVANSSETDDNSQKDLVTADNSAWEAHCSAETNNPMAGRTSQ